MDIGQVEIGKALGWLMLVFFAWFVLAGLRLALKHRKEDVAKARYLRDNPAANRVAAKLDYENFDHRQHDPADPGGLRRRLKP